MIKERTSNEVVEELKKFNGVETITRDFSTSYKSAISEALPNAKQIVDRFHIDENYTDNLYDYMKRTMTDKLVIDSKNKEENKEVLTIYEKKKQDTANKKWQLIQRIKQLKAEGNSNVDIASEVGLCDDTVAKYLNYDKPPVQHSHSKLDEFIPYIKEAILENKTKKQIYEYIQSKGYSGKESILYHHLKSIRNEVKNEVITLKRSDLKKILFVKNVDDIKSKSIRLSIKTYLEKNTEFKQLLELRNEFRALFYSNNKDVTKLDEWIEKSKNLDIPEMKKFVNLIESDIDAVKNAIIYDYSNGVTEGFNNKTKVIKREMYGRCSFDLLKIKVLA